MMTFRQRQLLRFIENYINKNDGVAPSFQEMADGIGLKSKSGIHRIVASLEERGKIRRLHYRARAIETANNRMEQHDTWGAS